LQVSLENRLLVISGVRDDAAERRAYNQMEIRSGEFRIELEIPIPVDARGIEAHYEDGFLRVILKRPAVVRVSPSESE
ncbi:MAG: Hsp20/alpha crystallin family protein, partial [Chloroflexi bacterium]|nr:Hsp20/alpha crystallin family protein [Chloroflexota bacterium]